MNEGLTFINQKQIDCHGKNHLPFQKRENIIHLSTCIHKNIYIILYKYIATIDNMCHSKKNSGLDTVPMNKRGGQNAL